MRPRFRSAARILAAFVVVGLLAPAASAPADEATQLARTRQQLAAIRQRLKAAKGQEAQILKEVRALNSKIYSLDSQIGADVSRIASLESEMRSATAQIAKMSEEYAKARLATNRRARNIYMQGPLQPIDRLLQAESIGEFVRAMSWLEVAAEQDDRVMLQAARLKGEMQDRREILESVTAEVKRRKALLSERRSLVDEARSDRRGALGNVQDNIQEAQRHIRELEAASRRLTAILRSRVSRSNGRISRLGFIWPLRGRVTSEYGRRWGGFHSGIDIDGNTGDPIKASKAGVIVNVNCGSGYGICTVVDHGNGVATLYAHMSRRARGGGHVSQGTVLGYVGCTGSCTGSHLHFEVRVNGNPRNPRGFLP